LKPHHSFVNTLYMGMLHPSAVSLIGLYSVSTPTKMSLSDGKN